MLSNSNEKRTTETFFSTINGIQAYSANRNSLDDGLSGRERMMNHG
jgi:hypothetical protein